MRKVGEWNHLIANLSGDLANFLMRPFEEVFENSQLVHHLQRRRMDRVPAEVAQKIRLLLKHDNFDSGAAQKKSQPHSGASPTAAIASILDSSRTIPGSS